MISVALRHDSRDPSAMRTLRTNVSSTDRLVDTELHLRSRMDVGPILGAPLPATTASELDALYSLAKWSSNHSWTLLTRLVSNER